MDDLSYEEWLVTRVALMQKYIDEALAQNEALIDCTTSMGR